MKPWSRFLLATSLALLGVFTARAQQQPVLSVAIETVTVGATTFDPPNEAFGPAGQTINISAFATGTFLQSSYTYSFFVNGINIGVTSGVVAPPDRAVVSWTPPQPGSYFLTVQATDGANTATSLPIRYFATGTVVNSPVTNTIVPQGSSVVLKADATVARGFIRQIQFYANGQPIGSPDTTIPYSVIYKPTGAAGTSPTITAQATDNNGDLLAMSDPISLSVVTAITPLPTSSISTPSDESVIPIPTGDSPTPLTIAVDAHAATGLVSKVELYIDGVLFGTRTNFPYRFDWLPNVVGTYRLVALTYDDKNNVVASSLSRVLIAAPPTVTVVSPSNGSTVNGGSPTQIKVIATDSNTDVNGQQLQITSVEFFVDGTSVGSDTTPNQDGEFSTAATLTQKVDEDGNPKPSSITAVATNSGGISGVSNAILVDVTKGGSTPPPVIGIPPSVTVISPGAGSQLPVNAQVHIGADAFDPDGNIESVEFFVNDKSVGLTSLYRYNVAWTPTSLGTYRVTARATDNDGNIVTSAVVVVTVVDFSSNFPTVAISSPVNGASARVNGAVTINALANDFDGNIEEVQFFVNGNALGQPDSTFPFQTQWTPTAEGIYRLSVSATDNSGARVTSAPVIVVVSSSGGDSVSTGMYQGMGEAGNFAVISATGKTAAFIGFSTTPGVNDAYFYSGVPVNVGGGFGVTDASNQALLAGSVSDIGTTGTLDSGRLLFVGTDTQYLPAGGSTRSGFYSGTIAGRAGSTLAAIVGSDGSILFYAQDGSFVDAGGGGLTGKLDSNGSFNIITQRGNQFTGRVDPNTRVLTGSLSGSNGGEFTVGPALLGNTSGAKLAGLASEVGPNIQHANGNTYDQVLLLGASGTVTADPGQVTRISFADLNGDLVQVEFAGAGTLSVTLDNPSGPKLAQNYNQPGVSYMQGHARLLITGADETTNVSIFSVGRLTAGNQTLFKSEVNYDGVADLAYLVILSTNGRFGGVRAANANFFATSGLTGLCAPGVHFEGPVNIGDINANGSATPMLLIGSGGTPKITGGSLWQSNGQAVQISGFSQLSFVDGTDSHGGLLKAQANLARLERDGIEVASQVALSPAP